MKEGVVRGVWAQVLRLRTGRCLGTSVEAEDWQVCGHKRLGLRTGHKHRGRGPSREPQGVG